MKGENGCGTNYKPRCLPAVFMPPMLCLKPSGFKGQGVFALRRFLTNEIVERVQVVVLPGPQWRLLNRTDLRHYYYKWGADAVAIASGFGLFYNHSDLPNARCVKHVNEQVMEWIAIRDIEPDEEITIRYDCPLWFEAL